MSQTPLSRTASPTRPHLQSAATAFRFLLATLVALAFATVASAEDGWSLRLEPMLMDAFGHDQHVLTIRDISGTSESATAVKLDTQSGQAYRSELQFTRGNWTWGWDFLWFATSQDADVTGSSIGNDELIFEIPGREFHASDAGPPVFYRTLEDTDLAIWTFDLYGMKAITFDDDAIQLQFGVRFADFDNDYRAAAGIEGDHGTRIDASSNYGRMTGPLLGIAGDLRSGRNAIQGYFGQSIVFGSADLVTMSRDFVGAFSEAPDPDPAFISESSFERLQENVAIPITELRVKWTYHFTNHLGAGLGANASAWWDVPVPPGAVPGREQELEENTIIFLGVFAALEINF